MEMEIEWERKGKGREEKGKKNGKRGESERM